MQGETEKELIKTTKSLIRKINHGRAIPDLTSFLASHETATLTTKQQILLLNVIVLSQPTNASFLSHGEKLFEEIASSIMSMRQSKIGYIDMELLLPRQRYKHKFLVDLHQPMVDQEGKAFESEQYQGVGFTYFFLKKAKSLSGHAFYVDPGVGHGSTYFIGNYNPTRYAVHRYLHDMLAFSEEPLKTKILLQINNNYPHMIIPSDKRLLETETEITDLIKDVFDTCRPAAKITEAGEATTDESPTCFNNTTPIKRRISQGEQRKQFERRVAELSTGTAQALPAPTTIHPKDMKFFRHRDETKALTPSAVDKKVGHDEDPLKIK